MIERCSLQVQIMVGFLYTRISTDHPQPNHGSNRSPLAESLEIEVPCVESASAIATAECSSSPTRSMRLSGRLVVVTSKCASEMRSRRILKCIRADKAKHTTVSSTPKYGSYRTCPAATGVESFPPNGGIRQWFPARISQVCHSVFQKVLSDPDLSVYLTEEDPGRQPGPSITSRLIYSLVRQSGAGGDG